MQLERGFNTNLSTEWKNQYLGDQFGRLIGNDLAKNQITTIAFDAMSRENHSSPVNVAWIGPPGTGKTNFAGAYARALGLPFIEPQNVSNADDIFVEMQRKLSQCRLGDGDSRSCMMQAQEDGNYIAPACIIFLDEVHKLRNNVQQDLLRAVESGTHVLECKGFKVDTRNVTWHIATTDRGLLFDAFDTRFKTIELQPYSKDEIAQIVHKNFPKIPFDACKRISRYYYLITREANDAANMVMMYKSRHNLSWIEAVEMCRRQDGIDDYGLTRKRLAVLVALGGGKKSLASLANAVGCKIEELERFVLPPLMIPRNGVKPFVEVGSGGRYITRQGLVELDRRRIPHNGIAALAKAA